MNDAPVDTRSLYTVSATDSLADAARAMCDRSMGALGITWPDGRLAGIVTERDVTWLVAQGRDPAHTVLADVMNDFPVVVDGPIGRLEAAARMRAAHVRHLLVSEGDDVRIVSMRDLLTDEARPLVAADAMTRPAVACRDTAFFEEAAELLATHGISGCPVVDDAGTVVGVVSERDLAHCLGGPLVRLALRRGLHDDAVRDVAELPREARRVRDVMTAPAIVVTPDAPLGEVAFTMSRDQINRVPVVSDGELVGVLTRGDVLAGLSGHLAPRPATPAPARVFGTGGGAR
jgi:CBS domain-containing protein